MKHLAIIMDWNRRWAAEQWVETHFWHKAWAENVEKIVLEADKRGIEFITLWWLSTENLQKRSTKEVSELIKIIMWAKKYLKSVMENNGKIELIWDIEKLPKKAQETLNYLVSKTKNNTGIVVIIALLYGGKNEIIRWIK
jgi:undecaprenyl diphosphate synthase